MDCMSAPGAVLVSYITGLITKQITDKFTLLAKMYARRHRSVASQRRLEATRALIGNNDRTPLRHRQHNLLLTNWPNYKRRAHHLVLLEALKEAEITVITARLKTNNLTKATSI